MAYDTRNGGAGATPPFYSGSSLNPQRRAIHAAGQPR